MCSRARRRRVSMSEMCVPAIYLLVVLLVVPLPAYVFVSAFLASARLMSAFARSCSALACFSQALFSLPFWSSQRSLATSYAASALASCTLRWFAAVGFVLALSSALATFSLPLASFSQTSLAFAFIVSHLALAALYSASMRSSSAFLTWRVVVFCACAPVAKASATAILKSWNFMWISLLTGYGLLRRPATSETRNSTTNTTNRILAISAAPEAMPVKPKTAAMIATMKKAKAQLSMATP